MHAFRVRPLICICQILFRQIILDDLKHPPWFGPVNLPADKSFGSLELLLHTLIEARHLVLGTVHGPGYAGAGGKSKWFRQDFEIADDWHIFAIDWNAERIQWFFDDEMYFELTPADLGRREWVFDKPFFLILNLAHGGTLGGFIDPELEYPIQYLADYVRVYQPTDA